MNPVIRVRDGIAHVTSGGGEGPGAPFRTAIVEAAGALLHWDVTAGASSPDADIDDVPAAAGWLADIYGPEVARAVVAGSDAVVPVVADDARVTDAVRRLGLLTWARDWWPAGAGIPSLEPALLAAEIALTSHAVSHLLDDEDAVARALADALDATSALAALPAALAAEGAEMSAALADIAEDHGVALLPASPARAEWALAAGGSAPAHAGVEIAAGTAAVRWGDVPAQTVDAEAEARWVLHQHAGRMTVRVEVLAVDRAATEALRARFGPAASAIDLALERRGDRFAGEAEVPSSVAFLPAHERTLWIRDPVLAQTQGEPENAEDRERVLRFARDRRHAPSASLAERAAGAAP